MRTRRLLAATAALLLATGCVQAVVFSSTNGVGFHVTAPDGEWSGSGWEQTAAVGAYLATVIHSNAALTAKHIGFGAGAAFTYQGQSRTVTAVVTDPGSDLCILRFEPAATNWALLAIEPGAETGRWAVVQGRGRERGALVTTGSRTNGWRWGANDGVRRWGINRYEGFADYLTAGDAALAWATFDEGAQADECMLSQGDSGGPSFVRGGSRWYLAAVSFAVFPVTFNSAPSAAGAFQASLVDCSGLYYQSGTNWVYVTPANQPVPAAFFSTAVPSRLNWLTNSVPAITFDADLGLDWHGGGLLDGSAAQAAEFTLTVTNRGPYAACDVAVDLAWAAPPLTMGPIRVSSGSYAESAGRWSLPRIEDGAAATLVATCRLLRLQDSSGTNTAVIAAAGRPDPIPADNAASVAFSAAPTASLLLIQ